MSNILAAASLSIGYPGKTVAADLKLTLTRGRLVCLLGPNGAGKSTLMRTLCAMQPPISGQVLLDGMDIHSISPRELARLLSVVLTDRIQVGLLSAYELVSLGRYPYTGWSGRLSPDDHRIIRESIEATGATDLASRPVDELSDGERQKVLMARALAQQPKLLILDEVTAFLDLPRRVDIMRTLRSLAHQRGATILLSTHDLDLALRTADEIWLLEKGGAFHTGAPEDLILDGHFAAAFRSEGIEFNAEQGHFDMHGERGMQVSVHGDGLAAKWTCRAMERLGMTVVSQSPLRIVLEPGSWRIESIASTGTYPSIAALAEALRGQTTSPRKEQ
ncbi:MAG TPA: ABC transporter ATP-binding protein [Bryobacteraceae bacterium]|nr:ABC transporter ATP-binding protein [Bryobacteraceae bacterium]